jgi:hypothetical protein
MNGGHNPVATELQETDKNLQFMTVVNHNNDPPTTRRSNLTAQSGIMHAFHYSAGSRLRNRKVGMEQIALTTHKTHGVISSHARSGDSIEGSIEPFNSARINGHGEAALTATASQAIISNASNALAKTNNEGCNEADNIASDTKIKDSITEINESFTNPLLQSADPMQHTLSTGLEQHPTEKKSTVRSSR